MGHTRGVELTRLHDQLVALLRHLGVSVRCETFDIRLFGDSSTRGGLCTLRNQRVVLVDARNTLVDKVAVLAQAASQLDTETVFVTPAVREAIRIYAHGGAVPPLRSVPESAVLKFVPTRPGERPANDSSADGLDFDDD